MARNPKVVKLVDDKSAEDPNEDRFEALEKRVQELHDMVVFLAQNPHVRVDDYLRGVSYAQ